MVNEPDERHSGRFRERIVINSGRDTWSQLRLGQAETGRR